MIHVRLRFKALGTNKDSGFYRANLRMYTDPPLGLLDLDDLICVVGTLRHSIIVPGGLITSTGLVLVVLEYWFL